MLFHGLRVLYLHGFASSIHSRKAQFFARMLQAEGIDIEAPALDEGDFEHLTITGQLRVIERAAGIEPAVLIGSSLGGYLAALYAAEHPQVLRLVLLAPAFRFLDLWTTRTSAVDLEHWRNSGSVPIFHYGEGRDMPIDYRLIEDAQQYPGFPNFSQPALIFHGNQDTSVPVEYSVEFVQTHPNAHLIRMNSGHELTDVLDKIWGQSSAFLLHGRT